MITRALIIKKKWLDLILSGEKVWEMRSRPTTIRGPIGLIESGSGLIVGHAYLTASDIVDPSIRRKTFVFHSVSDQDMLEKYPYAWVLTGASKYDKPIPYKHPKGAVIWVNLEKQGITL